jgi:hypothetical protein
MTADRRASEPYWVAMARGDAPVTSRRSSSARFGEEQVRLTAPLAVPGRWSARAADRAGRIWSNDELSPLDKGLPVPRRRCQRRTLGVG